MKTRLCFEDEELNRDFEEMSKSLYMLLNPTDDRISVLDFERELGAVLTEDKVAEMGVKLNEHLEKGEKELYGFLKDDLIPAVLIDSKGNVVPYNTTINYKVHCRSCGEITRHVVPVDDVMMDAELFGQIKNGNFDTSCHTRRCKSKKGVQIISSSNKFVVETPYPHVFQTGVYHVSGRVKGGSALRDKFIRYLTDGKKTVIIDVIAGRVVCTDEDSVESVKDRLAYLAKMNGNDLRGGKRVEYKNFPLKEHTTKPEYSAIHVDFPHYKRGEPRKCFDTLEIQLRTAQCQQWCDDERSSLNHEKYKSVGSYKQVDSRIEVIRKYLTPLFQSYELSYMSI